MRMHTVAAALFVVMTLLPGAAHATTFTITEGGLILHALYNHCAAFSTLWEAVRSRARCV
jgi:hypothetical protein